MKQLPFFTTVTSFSKILAAVLFVSFPIAGFFLGMEYQKGITPLIVNNNGSQVPIVKIPSPTIDQISNWKEYINTAYNYSIKHPPNWTVGIKGEADPSTFYAPYLESPCNYEAGDRCGQINITAEDFDQSKTLDEYFRLTTTDPWSDRVINKMATTLGKEEAIGMEWFKNNYFYGSGQDEHGIVLRTVKAIHNDKVYSVSVTENGKDRAAIKSTSDWKHNDLYGQILSTFKFLE